MEASSEANGFVASTGVSSPWSMIGVAGLGANDAVSALAVNPATGDLIAGGIFTYAAATPARLVASLAPPSSATGSAAWSVASQSLTDVAARQFYPSITGYTYPGEPTVYWQHVNGLAYMPATGHFWATGAFSGPGTNLVDCDPAPGAWRCSKVVDSRGGEGLRSTSSSNPPNGFAAAVWKGKGVVGGSFDIAGNATRLGGLAVYDPVMAVFGPLVAPGSGAFLPYGNANVYALATSPANPDLLILGGFFTSLSDGTLLNHVAIYDAAANATAAGVSGAFAPLFSRVGATAADVGVTGVGGTAVYALAVMGDIVYVGGSFAWGGSGLNQVTFKNFAAYSTTAKAWQPTYANAARAQWGGVSNTVRALLADAASNTVYIGGDFESCYYSIYGTTTYPCGGVAMYRAGSSGGIYALGTGIALPASVTSLAILPSMPSTLLAGGSFGSANGGLPLNNLATFDLRAPSPTPTPSVTPSVSASLAPSATGSMTPTASVSLSPSQAAASPSMSQVRLETLIAHRPHVHPRSSLVSVGVYVSLYRCSSAITLFRCAPLSPISFPAGRQRQRHPHGHHHADQDGHADGDALSCRDGLPERRRHDGHHDGRRDGHNDGRHDGHAQCCRDCVPVSPHDYDYDSGRHAIRIRRRHCLDHPGSQWECHGHQHCVGDSIWPGDGHEHGHWHWHCHCNAFHVPVGHPTAQWQRQRYCQPAHHAQRLAHTRAHFQHGQQPYRHGHGHGHGHHDGDHDDDGHRQQQRRSQRQHLPRSGRIDECDANGQFQCGLLRRAHAALHVCLCLCLSLALPLPRRAWLNDPGPAAEHQRRLTERAAQLHQRHGVPAPAAAQPAPDPDLPAAGGAAVGGHRARALLALLQPGRHPPLRPGRAQRQRRGHGAARRPRQFRALPAAGHRR